jgi:cation:H+ antiporter
MLRNIQFNPIYLAILAGLPGLFVFFAHIELAAPVTALVSGIAIMGAAFLLLWACDAAQADISQTLALAIIALIAVLPEYAVDIYFTWQAGRFPESDYSQYAVANMTGANRLLIGVAWTVIAAIFWIKTRKPVDMGRERRTELLFLGMATLYAFVIPIKGSLTLLDGIVFVGIYAWYLTIASKRPCEECEVQGPAHLILRLPKLKRRLVTLLMLLFSAGTILINAKPFCEGLVETGKAAGINEFLLVQWLAPIASEMPEFVVAILFALRGKAGLALGSLLSAKLNQWTLLVGMIPGVFAVSHGSLQHPIPMGSFQMNEILLTAAQSLLAVIILANLRLTIGQALLLFGLFSGQLVAPALVSLLPGGTLLGMRGEQMHPLFAGFYCLVSIALVLDYPRRFSGFLSGLKVVPDDVRPPGPLHKPHAHS